MKTLLIHKTKWLVLFMVHVLFRCNAMFSQDISGKVVDENGAPLPFASVVAYTLPDTVMIGGNMCDTLGRFTLAAPCDLLRISFVSYEPTWITSPQGYLGEISMRCEATLLHEIKVKAIKPTITYQPDRIVVDVQNSILANTTDVMEMLSLTPGVLVNPLGSISVLGKGTPIIYINHHRVQSMSEIESLDPQLIKSVDVINTPTAKYDADAAAVIIITTIRRNDFYNVRIGGVLRRKRDWSESGYMDINFLRRRLSGNLYYQYREDRTIPEERTTYYGEDGYLLNLSYPYRHHYGGGSNMRASVDYDIAPNHSIGWQGNAMFSSLRNTMDRLVQNDYPGTYDFHVPSGLKGRNKMYYSTLYYNWDIDSIGQKLEATFDYTHSEYDRCDTFRNIPLGASYLDYVLNSNINAGSNEVYIGKVDYTLPVGENFKLYVGSKHAVITGDSKTELSGFSNYETQIKTNESNLSGYLEGLLTLSEKWSLIAGIRAERMHRSNIENGNVRLVFKEQGLFPHLNIQFIPKESYSIGASYSKTVARPSFAELNPSLTVDSLSNSIGNPNLTNSYTHNFSISLGLPHGIGASFYYNRIMNPLVQSIQTSADNPNVLERRWYNGNPYNSYSVSCWANLYLTSWYYLYLSAYYDRNCYVFESEGVAIINDKPCWGGYIGNTISLPGNWKIALNAQLVSSHSALTQIKGSAWNLYFQAGKEMFNKALKVTLCFNDILGTDVSRQWSLLPGNKYTYFDSDGRLVSLIVNYKIGKAKKTFRSRTASDEERGRLEQ